MKAPDSNRRLIHDTIRVDSGRSILKYQIMEAKVVNNTISLRPITSPSTAASPKASAPIWASPGPRESSAR